MIGKKIWAIAEGFIPSQRNGPGPQMTSHETAYILTTYDEEVRIELHLYFSDQELSGPYPITVPSRRTKHLRFNDLVDPAPVPKDTDYASFFISDVPVVIQHTRLDSRQAENAILSTTAFAGNK